MKWQFAGGRVATRGNAEADYPGGLQCGAEHSLCARRWRERSRHADREHAGGHGTFVGRDHHAMGTNQGRQYLASARPHLLSLTHGTELEKECRMTPTTPTSSDSRFN